MIHKFTSNDNKGNVNIVEFGSTYTKLGRVPPPVKNTDAANKEYVDSVAGGSGGGVLVVNGTIDETGIVLGKTWQEIHDGGFGIVKWQADKGLSYWPIVNVYYGLGRYGVGVICEGENGPDIIRFTTNSASGYPFYTFEVNDA